MVLINLPIILKEIYRVNLHYRYIIHLPEKIENKIMINLSNIFVNKRKKIIVILIRQLKRKKKHKSPDDVNNNMYKLNAEL